MKNAYLLCVTSGYKLESPFKLSMSVDKPLGCKFILPFVEELFEEKIELLCR